MPLEEGLFSTLSYNVGDVIAQLHGEYITNQQYQKAGKRACLVIRLRKWYILGFLGKEVLGYVQS